MPHEVGTRNWGRIDCVASVKVMMVAGISNPRKSGTLPPTMTIISHSSIHVKRPTVRPTLSPTRVRPPQAPRRRDDATIDGRAQPHPSRETISHQARYWLHSLRIRLRSNAERPAGRMLSQPSMSEAELQRLLRRPVALEDAR